MIKCPICFSEVDEKDYKEVYISPYNNQEYKRYECPNCDLHWWEPLKIIPEFYENEILDVYTRFHTIHRDKLGTNHEPFFKYFPKDVNCLEIAGFKSIEVFKTDFLFYDLFPFIEKKLLGNLDDIKIWLKVKVLGDKRMSHAIAVEDLDKFSQDKLKVGILKTLKLVRNAILLKNKNL